MSEAAYAGFVFLATHGPMRFVRRETEPIIQTPGNQKANSAPGPDDSSAGPATSGPARFIPVCQ